ncbi:uncharacterized protein LOC113750340 [Coffea eugenioides]|uniref:uncharacterized protein LOC113750340 n=1 Tax=Coffea eugenioides TaxID=49369 RepID=UPI000F615446|nr:uncharacterized protein LOC113750340 [Coffea eugenioides]
MAESTRFKTLEEQVRKQEAKLQEIMENLQSSQSSQQQLRGEIRQELEENNRRMESLMTGMEQKFGAFLEQKFSSIMLNVTAARDKLPDEESRGRTEQAPPLLPTPPPQFRLYPDAEVTRAFRHEGRIQAPNPPKLDLQLFSGENPREWLRKCNKYFINYQIPNEQKIAIVEMYLEGKTDRWFQGVRIEKPRLSWEEFGEILCKRFNENGYKDIIEEFNKLQQEGSVEEYQERFEELKPLMLARNSNLDESYFTSSFISGLKEEIKPMVKMLRPTTLSEAFEISLWQERNIKIQIRGVREGHRNVAENKFGMTKGTTPVAGSTNTYQIPSTGNFRNTKFKNVQTDRQDSKRISPQEIQHRRSLGLCFKCGDKYGPGHQCKPGHLNLLISEDEEEPLFEDALGEQDDQTGHPGQVMDMSLHALSEALKRKTITLTGKLDGEEVLILVDTGSSDSYINSELVIGMDIKYQMVSNPFSVIMGNGTCVNSNAICPSVMWEVNQYKFRFDLKVMELGGWDIILGVDWMVHFSPITFDFHQLSISLFSQGQTVHLQGQAENCDMDLIRGKDLRYFIEYKKQMCAAMEWKQNKDGDDHTIPRAVENILSEYADVFKTPDSLPPKRSIDHEITLKPGSQPVKLKPYRYPHSQKGEIEKQVTEMLEHGIVIHSTSPFASPVLLVKKKEGTWRFCVDYRKLNEMTIKDKYPIPNVEELLDELAGAVFKSKLDLTAGYHQIRVKTQDTHKTAFQTHCGHYEFLVMPFGLTNAPATFQSLMNQVFQPYLRKFVLVFFDDILVYSPTLESHVQHLKIVLDTLRQNQLYAKKSKCSFAQKTVDYLGHTISEKGVSMDQTKIDCILKWPIPQTVKELRSFFGFDWVL